MSKEPFDEFEFPANSDSLESAIVSYAVLGYAFPISGDLTARGMSGREYLQQRIDAGVAA